MAGSTNSESRRRLIENYPYSGADADLSSTQEDVVGKSDLRSSGNNNTSTENKSPECTTALSQEGDTRSDVTPLSHLEDK